MDGAPLALLLSRASVIREVESARPGAPVVPAGRPRRPRRPRVPRTRTALAGALHRAAEALTPHVDCEAGTQAG
ncbi:hypothetical protein [Actinotalea subterranea]|uniref:hypothetical protein n=1 Tax=Actinotalea subterranea TaxID=2607497 RepID=UPI0011EFAA81|nr:hypothetical protein [Actinotalea subterranea]